MENGAVVADPAPGWAVPLLEGLLPGAHAAVLGTPHGGVEARRAGFEVRDTLLVVGPSVRLALLLRKPIESPTVAEQVRSTGTGALWIDGCRTRYQSEADKRLETRGVHVGGAYQHPAGSAFKKQVNAVAAAHDLGRWPTNLVFLHYPGCRQSGVKGGNGDETVAAWDCEPGCIVTTLDEQSGARGNTNPTNRSKTVGFPRGVAGEGVAGGASRFFPQFQSDREILDWLRRLLGAHERSLD